MLYLSRMLRHRYQTRRCPFLLMCLCLAVVSLLTFATVKEVKDTALWNREKLLHVLSARLNKPQLSETYNKINRNVTFSYSFYHRNNHLETSGTNGNAYVFQDTNSVVLKEQKTSKFQQKNGIVRLPPIKQRADIRNTLKTRTNGRTDRLGHPLISAEKDGYNTSHGNSASSKETQTPPDKDSQKKFRSKEESYKTLHTKDGESPAVVDGIYWSQLVESSIPKGLTNEEADAWLTTVHSARLDTVEAASWNRCGRPQNAFVTLQDGTSLCARYRTSRHRLVLGEVLSYWLSRLLGMDCVPPVTLASSGSLLKQRSRDFHSQGLWWNPGQTVALIRWLNEIDSRPSAHVFMPSHILEAYRSGRPVTSFSVSQRHTKRPISEKSGPISRNKANKTSAIRRVNDPKASSALKMEDLTMLAQWGTLIIFDYLTGNYDRVASMQDGAERENDPRILEEPIRNLRSSDKGAKLWLIDNESGLLDSYVELYQGLYENTSPSKFIRFHDTMLRTMCVFQRGVVRNLKRLHQETKPHHTLMRFAAERDSLVKEMERDESFDLFRKKFSERLEIVVKWIRHCSESERKRI